MNWPIKRAEHNTISTSQGGLVWILQVCTLLQDGPQFLAVQFPCQGLTISKVSCYLFPAKDNARARRILPVRYTLHKQAFLAEILFILFLFAAKPKFLIELNQRFFWI